MVCKIKKVKVFYTLFNNIIFSLYKYVVYATIVMTTKIIK